MSKNNEKRCNLPGAFRYTWPGREESFICLPHSGWLREVAANIDLQLQLIPIPAGEQSNCLCTQIIGN